jgi:hypothetical protein
MKVVSKTLSGLHCHLLAILLLMAFSVAPFAAFAQDDGDDKKEKPAKEEKVKAEKPEKAPKVKPEKPPKAPKPEKEPKAAKAEKPAKEPKAAKESGEEKATREKPDKSGDGGGGGEDGGKKKKKKGKKGDSESPDQGGANTANERFHANNADSTVKHGYAVPCARYRRGSMEYIDKNNMYITIRRSRHKEVQVNSNRGMRETKTRKITRDQKIDKSKTKMRLDKEGKLKDKGNKLVFKIEWTSDCTYKLTFKRSKKPTKFKKGWEMDCMITKCYEDYYDCDCDLHDIIQYTSVRKKLTKSEIAARQRQEVEELKAKEAEALAVEDQNAKAAEEAARIKAAEDEIFGPIKRIKADDPAQPGITPGETPAPDPGAKEAQPTTPAAKADPAAKKADPKKKEEDSKAGNEKPEKEPKAKGDKTPKEKKEKPEKGDKAPKEPKVKAAKEPKAPKEKKEKAPKEPEAPKEPKVKAEKEPKAPKEPKVKPEKEPKAPKEGDEG